LSAVEIMKTKIVLAALASALAANANADTFSVAGASGPWQYVNGGLNTSFQYGVDDQLGPTVVSSIGGTAVGAGQQISVSYLSGTVNSASTGVFPNNSFVDANGIPSLPNPDASGPNEHGVCPSFYMGESVATPIYVAELVGTFANSLGQIVGNPFALGDGPSILSVPGGATRLQLGVNDNLYADNIGSWNLDVEFVPVPEPSTAAVLGFGALAAWVRLRKRQAFVRQTPWEREDGREFTGARIFRNEVTPGSRGLSESAPD
jgi:hypothetical protein